MEADRPQPYDFEPAASNGDLDDWEAEIARESREARRTLLSFVSILVAFKLVVLAFVIFFLFQAGFGDTLTLIVATHVPFALLGLGLLYFPISSVYRRLRLRALRRRLIWAEWHVEEQPTSTF